MVMYKPFMMCRWRLTKVSRRGWSRGDAVAVGTERLGKRSGPALQPDMACVHVHMQGEGDGPLAGGGQHED